MNGNSVSSRRMTPGMQNAMLALISSRLSMRRNSRWLCTRLKSVARIDVRRVWFWPTLSQQFRHLAGAVHERLCLHSDSIEHRDK